jgi:predicted nucleotidyltransferase
MGKEIKPIRKEMAEKLAKDLSDKLVKKYGDLIIAVLLFGSTVRDKLNHNSDIDMTVIIDDTEGPKSDSFLEKLDTEIGGIAKKVNEKISVQGPVELTEFWHQLHRGNPTMFNIVREAKAVYDRSMFRPVKRLLEFGTFHPTLEMSERLTKNVEKRMKRARNAMTYIVLEDCYNAMIETARAALIMVGKVPPRPAELPKMLRETIVKMRLLKEADVKSLEKIIKFSKDEDNRKKINGKELDKWFDLTDSFIIHTQEAMVKMNNMKLDRPLPLKGM